MNETSGWKTTMSAVARGVHLVRLYWTSVLRESGHKCGNGCIQRKSLALYRDAWIGGNGVGVGGGGCWNI